MGALNFRFGRRTRVLFRGAAREIVPTTLPRIFSVSPNSGAASGGVNVTITGLNFLQHGAASSVSFGANPATSFTVNSDTQISAVVPAGTGTVNIVVVTPEGSGVGGSFAYVSLAPTVTSVSPTSGDPAGNTPVIITGTNFTGVTGVSFGAVAATTYTVNSATQITASSPAGTGIVNIRVSNADGTSPIAAGNQFTYTAAPLLPTVTAVSPNSGASIGGTAVTITGTDFIGVTGVSFGGTALSVLGTPPPAPTITNVSPNTGTSGTGVVVTGTNFIVPGYTVVNTTQITATAPAGTGLVNVTVTTGNGTSVAAAGNQYTFNAPAAPTVTVISPTGGPVAGGTPVTITGTGFNMATTTAVHFGATAATSFVINSPTSITAHAPAGTGVVNVRVTTGGVQSATAAANQFTYTGAALVAPVITSPNTANATEGTVFTYTITASGNPAPAIATGFNATGLPAWLTRTNNVVSGTPPAGSGNTSVTFTVTANNSEGTSPGVLVTVNIAPPAAAWTASHSWVSGTVFTQPPGGTGTIAINAFTMTGATTADLAAIMTYDLYTVPNAAAMPVEVWVRYQGGVHSGVWQFVPFDFFASNPGVNQVQGWGVLEANAYGPGVPPAHSIYLEGNNSTGNPIQVEIRRVI